jgi:hypothetical protein
MCGLAAKQTAPAAIHTAKVTASVLIFMANIEPRFAFGVNVFSKRKSETDWLLWREYQCFAFNVLVEVVTPTAQPVDNLVLHMQHQIVDKKRARNSD